MLTDGKYIKLSEVACKDGTPYPDVLEPAWNVLRDLFDCIREKWGAPLTVVSGYRSPEYNQRLIDQDNSRGAHGVASGSRHVVGQALDICPSQKMDVPQLYRVIKSMYDNGEIPKLGGIGLYVGSGWVHIDIYIPPDGHLRKWIGT